ncbi:Uncharacterised protein [Mycobacterium tuberculosis]|uniref:Uncharacterized protein n=1 Tax=Mycobacterium tuberculosis TaxID=1773 RepID=A0A0U0QS52_MYCTX|nr:Uncharacterised protein [Mycobacterium tuberculosis]
MDNSLEIAAGAIGSPPASVNSVERKLSSLVAWPSAINCPARCRATWSNCPSKR